MAATVQESNFQKEWMARPITKSRLKLKKNPLASFLLNCPTLMSELVQNETIRVILTHQSQIQLHYHTQDWITLR